MPKKWADIKEEEEEEETAAKSESDSEAGPPSIQAPYAASSDESADEHRPAPEWNPQGHGDIKVEGEEAEEEEETDTGEAVTTDPYQASAAAAAAPSRPKTRGGKRADRKKRGLEALGLLPECKTLGPGCRGQPVLPALAEARIAGQEWQREEAKGERQRKVLVRGTP